MAKHNLYTYVPKKNTLRTDGLYGPIGDTEENLARRYGYRAGSKDKLDILNWLESTAPGRSRAISVLTEPIPADVSENMRAFRNSSVQVTLPPYTELLDAGVIERPIYRSNINGPGLVPAKRISYRKLQWKRPNNTPLVFKGIRHYMLPTVDGHIPPAYLLAIAVMGQEEGMQKDAAMSADEKTLRRLARPFYPAVGRRSWEHVNQVKQNAEMMTQGLEHRPLTLQEKAAIYFHDCAIRQRGTGKEHGKYGRETAIPLLLSTGIFNDKQLKEIGQAILEHDTLNATGRKFSNRTGEVLASGDANTPDLPWLLNKFYNWQLQNNPDKDTWPADIYETAVEEFGNKSTEKFPALYNKFHGDRVQKLRDQIDSMSQDDMWNMVQKYRRKHHLSELDERLGKPPMFQPV